jgi:hypothetical protein
MEHPMSKTLTITLADDQYEALRAAAAQAGQAPEALAAALIAMRFAATPATPATSPGPTPFVDPVIAVMRANGHLVDPATLPPHPLARELPPPGSPEEARFLQELGEELSDALEQSGLSITDLIER